MAEELYEINIKINDDGSTATLKNMKNEVIASGIAIKEVNAQFTHLGESAAGASIKVQATSAQIERLKFSSAGASAATGSASSAIMELGRVASDAPYGIRGVANNVSQLTSTMFFMSSQVDVTTGKMIGFSGMIKQLRTAFMGPLGIMVAIQIVIAAIDYFAGSTKKAEEATKDLNKELKSQIDIFRLLTAQIQDQNLPLEERLKILKAVSRLDNALNKKLKAANGDREKETEILKNHLKQKELELAIKKQEIILNDAIAKEKEASAKADEQRAEVPSFAPIGAGGAPGFIVIPEKTVTVTKSKTIKDEEAAQKELNDALNIYIDLLAQQDLDEPTGPRTAAVEKLKKLYLDLEKEVMGYNARIWGDEKNIYLALEAEQKVEQALLAKKEADFQIKLQAQRDRQKELYDTGAITEEEYQKRLLQINKSGAEAILEYQAADAVLQVAQVAEKIALKEKMEKEHAERLLSANYEAATASNNLAQEQAKYGLDRLALEKEQIDAAYAEKQRLNALAIADAKETGLAIADIEKQQSTDAANYAAETLANDRATTEARIQVMGHFGAAAGALSSLMGEQTAAGKVFAIAAATIQTYVAGAQTMADPTIPSGPAKIAAMIAVIASGMATVKKIITTKVPGKSNAGGGGSGPTTFNPNFNVVGQSGQNQLAEVVAGQTNEATRAYVVYDDIASAQNIEQNAVQSSSFG
jgi:hypothetical protein